MRYGKKDEIRTINIFEFGLMQKESIFAISLVAITPKGLHKNY